MAGYYEAEEANELRLHVDLQTYMGNIPTPLDRLMQNGLVAKVQYASPSTRFKQSSATTSSRH